MENPNSMRLSVDWFPPSAFPKLKQSLHFGWCRRAPVINCTASCQRPSSQVPSSLGGQESLARRWESTFRASSIGLCIVQVGLWQGQIMTDPQQGIGSRTLNHPCRFLWKWHAGNVKKKTRHHNELQQPLPINTQQCWLNMRPLVDQPVAIGLFSDHPEQGNEDGARKDLQSVRASTFDDWMMVKLWSNDD